MAKRMTSCVLALWLSCDVLTTREAFGALPDNSQKVSAPTLLQDAPAEVEQAPTLVVEPTHVDLGVVRQGGTYDFSYVHPSHRQHVRLHRHRAQ
jgi:hypothetical protein